MIKKFPFGDTLLQDLGNLVPDKVTTYSIDTVIREVMQMVKNSVKMLKRDTMLLVLLEVLLALIKSYSGAGASSKYFLSCVAATPLLTPLESCLMDMMLLLLALVIMLVLVHRHRN